MSFIHAELAAGMAFARRAGAERAVGNEEGAAYAMGLARKAYGEAQHRMGQCDREHAPDAFDSARNKSMNLLAVIEIFAAG